MKVHFINCGTMYPRLATWFAPHLDRSPCICLLLETDNRLVLVDTGFGTRDMQNPKRLGLANYLLDMRADEDLTAISNVRRLGFDPRDVGDIVCTHLDRDHAGGLPDFSHARIHVSLKEYKAALQPRTLWERERYRRSHFAHGPKWVTYDTESGDRWMGIENVHALEGFSGEILLLPLHGHTRGHCGVAVNTEVGWLIHVGDAYYVMEELREKGKAPLGVHVFRVIAHINRELANLQLERLKTLLKEKRGSIRLIASHDQFEYRNIFGKPLE